MFMKQIIGFVLKIELNLPNVLIAITKDRAQSSSTSGIETHSASVYHKAKFESMHKDVPTSDWIRNLLFMGRTFQTAEMYYIQSSEIFPDFCMQLFLDKAFQILHSIPDAHRIGFMDSTGNLTRITKARSSWYQKIQNYFFLVNLKIKW